MAWMMGTGERGNGGRGFPIIAVKEGNSCRISVVSHHADAVSAQALNPSFIRTLGCNAY